MHIIKESHIAPVTTVHVSRIDDFDLAIAAHLQRIVRPHRGCGQSHFTIDAVDMPTAVLWNAVISHLPCSLMNTRKLNSRCGANSFPSSLNMPRISWVTWTSATSGRRNRILISVTRIEAFLSAVAKRTRLAATYSAEPFDHLPVTVTKSASEVATLVVAWSLRSLKPTVMVSTA